MLQVELPSNYMTKNDLTWLRHFGECDDVFTCLNVEGRKGRQTRDMGTGRATRKEYRMLTDEERNRFHNAIIRFKNHYVGGRSRYDIFLTFHMAHRSPAAHFGASFLPWHREYLKEIELALRTYDPTIGIPYWDSTLDEGLPDPSDSILFSPEFMGNANGRVVTGPFAYWRTTLGGFLERDAGRSGAPLYSPSSLAYIFNRSSFSQLTYCVDPFFEMAHGGIHAWVGGPMEIIEYSPNDPIFFLLHSFVDYLWEVFRQTKQTSEERETDYPPPEQCCSIQHSAQSTMLPFAKRNIDGLSNSYLDEFYHYEMSPSCNKFQPFCYSPYLFCDINRNRCLSKVMLGGSCAGFEFTDICYQGRCVNGVCI
ncbi:unnamed protein product [Soboliphyme baturini]|uniref:Tyrosinase_Cu-bd domain-containing protein n=1 Tax=Soboliphyme baturini TaxID=241478 RepID=A0A183IUG4_9BILA|nr:unnamed protein product [Soboliphyme baturini]